MDGLDISIADAPTRASGYQSQQRRRPRRFRLRRHARLLSFLLLVATPTVLAGTYLFGYASFQYVSEAKFVVRGPTAQAPGMLSSLLQTAGLSRAQDDTYAVQEYIQSRDAMNELIQAQNLRQAFDDPSIDPLSRFPAPYGGDTFEHFFKYYQSHVDVLLDSSTGVSTLTVKAFRAADAQRIATALLVAGERLVNRMNDRQRENAMHEARREVTLAEERVQDVSAQVAAFRNREEVLDPNKQSVPMLRAIDELQAMLSRTQLQVAQLAASSPNSPLIPDHQRRAAALQGQIDVAKAKVTGVGDSLVPKITAFDMLSLQRSFADKQLASATTSLEAARMQAERQQLYLDPVVQPNLPDYAAYPKRVADLAIVFASLVGIYVMGSLLIAGAREHRLA